MDRRYDDALDVARTALIIEPGAPLAQSVLQDVFYSKGMHDELLAHQREQLVRDPELVGAFDQGLTKGGYEGAQRGLVDLLAARWKEAGGAPGPGVFGPTDIAWRCVFAGDYDEAIDWFESAFEARDPMLPYIASWPMSNPLRSDPRFQDLLRRMNLPTTDAAGAP
jgi:tetratricopeptide (TPR) repeat protein